MENPKTVNSFALGFLVISGIGSILLSIYLMDPSPLVGWILWLGIVTIICAVFASVGAIVFWPLMLLLGKAFERTGNPSSSNTGKEETAGRSLTRRWQGRSLHSRP